MLTRLQFASAEEKPCQCQNRLEKLKWIHCLWFAVPVGVLRHVWVLQCRKFEPCPRHCEHYSIRPIWSRCWLLLIFVVGWNRLVLLWWRSIKMWWKSIQYAYEKNDEIISLTLIYSVSMKIPRLLSLPLIFARTVFCNSRAFSNTSVAWAEFPDPMMK